MLRRVNHFKSFDDPAGFLRRERLVEGTQAMRVEIVHHERDPFGLRSVDVDQLSNLVSPIDSCSLVGHRDVSPARQRFSKGENVCRSVPFIFAIEALDSSRLGLQRCPDLDRQLLAQLIHANQWKPRIIWTLVDFQYVFHVENELGVVLRGNTPHALLPGLQLVFFRQRRTVSCDTASTMFNSTIRSASSRSVHRAWPDGADPQHVATTFASFSPSRIFCRDGRTCFLRLRAISKPSSTRRLRMFSTVCTVTRQASAIASSFQPGPCLLQSATSNTCA